MKKTWINQVGTMACAASAGALLILSGCNDELQGLANPSTAGPYLSITTPSSAFTASNSACQSGFSVSQHNGDGSALVATSAVNVKISGIGAATLYADGTCTTAATASTITIPKGASSAPFSLKDSTVETLSLSGSSSTTSTNTSATVASQGTLSIGTLPTTAYACTNSGWSSSIAVTVKDGSGVTVTGQSNGVTLHVYSGSGCSGSEITTSCTGSNAPCVSSNTATAGNTGIATFSNFYYSPTAEPATVSFRATSSTATSSSCSSALTLNSSGASQLAVTSNALNTVNTASAVAVALEDACGATISSTDTFSMALYSDSACSSAVSSPLNASPVTLLSGASGTLSGGTASLASVLTQVSGAFYFKVTDTKSSSPDFGLNTCSSRFTVASASASALKVVTATTPLQGQCSSVITAGAADAYGNFTMSGTSGTHTLTVGVNGSAHLYTDSGCTHAFGGTYTMTTANPSVSLYLKDSTAEAITVSASDSAGLTAATLALFSSPGTTVQNYALVSGQPCEFDGIGKDNAGDIIALADCTGSDSNDHWIVRKSTDGGTTWTNIDDFVYSNGNSFNMPAAVAQDSVGNLWVTGSVDPNDGTGQAWITRELPNGSTTWATVDKYQYVSDTTACVGNNLTPYCNTGVGIAIDSNNNVFVAGYGTNDSAQSFGIIRRLPGGTVSPVAGDWTSVDGGATGYSGEGSITSPYVNTTGIAVDGTNVYWTGYYNDNSGGYWWVTRTATTTASTMWTTVDNFEYSTSTAGAYPQAGIAIDSSHNIFTAGFGTSSDSSAKHHWLVRKSSTQGTSASFSTVDDYDYACTTSCGSATATNNGGPSVASAIGINPTTGEIYVAGYEAQTNLITGSHAPARISTDHGTTWTMLDDFFYTYSYFTRAYFGVFTDSHFYWAGFGADTTNYDHALIRKY